LLCAATTTVQVQGRRLLVNGQVFTVKGVNYSPIPVGSTGGAPQAGCLNGADWWTDRPAYIADFPLIRQMGANTIRTYAALNDTSPSNLAQVRAMLDKAYENGLYVIMGYYPTHTGAIDAAFQASAQAGFLAGVNAYKDHPAVLMWAFGNEQNIDNGQDPAWYPFVNTVLGLSKAADPNHPAMSVEGECPQCTTPTTYNIGSVARSANDASMTNMDLWGMTAYRGTSFNGLFATLAAQTSKPLLLSEFGKDAFKDSVQAEDAAMQVRYLSAQWNEISASLSAQDASRPLIGAIWFEWTDEWWKADNGTTRVCTTHDSPVQFTRSSDTDDPDYNEEWFGLTAIRATDAISNPSGTARRLRPSYTTLQTLWAGASASGAAASASLLNGTVRNYPNPFRVGAEGTKFVIFTGRAAKVDIRLYDAGGQFVASLTQDAASAERVELNWDGKVSGGAYASPGLYVARIEAKAAGAATQTQFRRVVAVR